MTQRDLWFLALLLGCWAGGCARTRPRVLASEPGAAGDIAADEFADFDDEFAATEEPSYDPLERWNRGMFRFNDRLYDGVLRPVSKAYRAVTPEPIRTGTRNFFHNLAMPVRAVNCLLQGKFRAAGREVARFGVNAVVGVFGCADPAAEVFGWQAADEDFGQTLGVWGVEAGPFLVWPLAGPSTARDSGGHFVDAFLRPDHYVDDWDVEILLKGVEYTNQSASSIEQYDMIRQEALEPYIAVREGFLQHRRRAVQE